MINVRRNEGLEKADPDIFSLSFLLCDELLTKYFPREYQRVTSLAYASASSILNLISLDIYYSHDMNVTLSSPPPEPRTDSL